MRPGLQLDRLLVGLAVVVDPLQVHLHRAVVGPEAEGDLEAALPAAAAAAVKLGDLGVSRGGDCLKLPAPQIDDADLVRQIGSGPRSDCCMARASHVW